MLEVLAHANLPHQLVLVAVHSRQLADMCKYVLQPIRQLHTPADNEEYKVHGKGKGCPYSITECRVPQLIPVLGSQPGGDMSHKPCGRQPLLPPRLKLPPQLPISLLGEQRHNGCEQFVQDYYQTASRLRFEPGHFCA